MPAIGPSRGGRTTKLHARVDAQGRPLQLEVTAGNVADCTHATVLLGHISAAVIIGDKGYDSTAVVARIHASGARAVIPAQRTRKRQRLLDTHLYKARNLVERFFNRLKQWRGPRHPLRENLHQLPGHAPSGLC